ncbi:hypothetical protein, partial [Escherichia coli]|uniref:hypothetical protein n=1 Tax=Escherichia coli TaxID=562 RepID=UPI0006ACB87E
LVILFTSFSGSLVSRISGAVQTAIWDAPRKDYETECKNENLFRAATEDEKRKVVESVVFFYGSAVSRNVVQGEKLLPRFALPFLKIP